MNQSGERNLCNRKMLEWDISASTEVGHVLQTRGCKKYPPLPEGTNSKTPTIRFKVNYWLLRDQIICPVGYQTFQMNALWDFERQWVGLDQISSQVPPSGHVVETLRWPGSRFHLKSDIVPSMGAWTLERITRKPWMTTLDLRAPWGLWDTYETHLPQLTQGWWPKSDWTRPFQSIG